LFTDTVGFIQKLPTQLVAAFRATLEELIEADLLLHVVDASQVGMERQIEAVNGTLEDIGAMGMPVITVLNKTDRFSTQDGVDSLGVRFPNSVAISALTGDGLDQLLARIEQVLETQMVWLDVLVPYRCGELVDLFHRRGLIEWEEHTEAGTHIKGRVPTVLLGRFQGLQETARSN
jgi:GTP-binding protein HflX